MAFERILNVPKRSIGNTTIKTISEYAKKYKYSLEIASRKLIEENKIKPKTKVGLNQLLNLLEKWRNNLNNKTNHKNWHEAINENIGCINDYGK